MNRIDSVGRDLLDISPAVLLTAPLAAVPAAAPYERPSAFPST
jgi:hypothetical protein